MYGHRSHRCPLRSHAPPSEKVADPSISPGISASFVPAAPTSASVQGDHLNTSLEDEALGFSNLAEPNPAQPNPAEPISLQEPNSSHQSSSLQKPTSSPQPDSSHASRPSSHNKLSLQPTKSHRPTESLSHSPEKANPLLHPTLPQRPPSPSNPLASRHKILFIKPNVTQRPNSPQDSSPSLQPPYQIPLGPLSSAVSAQQSSPAQHSSPAQQLPAQPTPSAQKILESGSFNHLVTPSSSSHPISPHRLPLTPPPISTFTSLLLHQIEDSFSQAADEVSASEELEEGEFPREASLDHIADGDSTSVDDSSTQHQKQFKKRPKEIRKKRNKDKEKESIKQ